MDSLNNAENTSMSNIEEIEKRLWKSADYLRANSELASNEYFMPVMGLIFLRHAFSRYKRVMEELANDPTRASRGGKIKTPTVGEFTERGAILLDEKSQFDYLVAIPDGEDRAEAIKGAMSAIEKTLPTLKGTLPKQEYQKLTNEDLGYLLNIFNDAALEQADGDVFGRIYEYFLTEFADQGAHDGGEFFTPPSIVQTIVNIIEPNQGDIIDPACGSGGMFVQSAHFVERNKENPADKLTFYGMEKNTTTIRLAKMNLAVHGLEGDIQKAISYYDDPHKLVGKADFVMANPPFNVDEIDAEKIKNDPRLPFGLPGVNKNKKVSNGNYVWLSYFHAYLKDTGRAGVVMSSQASSAGGGEAKVREAMVKSGDIDIMVAIRGNFFYTRTVPCELWFYNKGKSEHLKDKVLMLDARQIFRKVTRAVYDFSPEQMNNLSSIVWLYRGENERFRELVCSYLITATNEAQGSNFAEYIKALTEAEKYFEKHTDTAEYTEALKKLKKDISTFESTAKNLSVDDGTLSSLKAVLEEKKAISEQTKGLIREIDHFSKVAARIQDVVVEAGEKAAAGKKHLNAIAETRVTLTGDTDEPLEVTGSLKRLLYFTSHAQWLLARFPEGEYADIEGLVKLVNQEEIAANDYSLTPGRYVGVTPETEDEDFDFDEVFKTIHEEIEILNDEAAVLAESISKNAKELIV